jgi:lysophospholipase L1-like esterase
MKNKFISKALIAIALFTLFTTAIAASCQHNNVNADVAADDGHIILYTDDFMTGLSWKADIEAVSGLEVHVFDFDKIKGRSQQAVDYFRLNNHLQYYRPKAVFFQLGCDGEADRDENYEQILFDHPTGEVCTLTGKMARNKRIAISKPDKNIAVNNFAGALYFMIRTQRIMHREARVFILPPVKSGQDVNPTVCRQLEHLANMLCLPFVQSNKELKEYAFLWNGKKPDFGKMLIIGDSYCQQRRWINSLEQLSKVEVVNLGVTSASMRDHFEDRVTYPYSKNPVQADCSGNSNTLGCQIVKLHRLLSGQNLLSGEQSLQGWQPDIILVEGGGNDFADEPAVEAQYENHIRNDIRTSFAGSLAFLTNDLKTTFPNAKIFIVVSAGLYYGHTDKPFEYMEKARQQRKAAKMLGYPTINWDKDGRLSFIYNNSAGTGNGSKSNPYRYNQPTDETIDLLHPNDYGAQFLAESAIHWITKALRQ